MSRPDTVADYSEEGVLYYEAQSGDKRRRWFIYYEVPQNEFCVGHWAATWAEASDCMVYAFASGAAEVTCEVVS